MPPRGTSVRSFTAVVLGLVGVTTGCHKSGGLSCGRAAAAQDLCTTTPCDVTWAAVQSNGGYCATCSSTTFQAADCGDYHLLTYAGADYGGTYYYDVASDALVAHVVRGADGRSTTCTEAPSASFALPSCSDAAFRSLPQWCASAGGAQPTFACCRDPIAAAMGCTAVGLLCPASWADVERNAAFCGSGSPALGIEMPEVASCGAYRVVRYGGTAAVTLYYDAASGALVAVTEQGSGCLFGNQGGFAAPACDTGFAGRPCAELDAGAGDDASGAGAGGGAAPDAA